jgi:hypothetical protein
MSPCVLFCDELDKALSGVGGQGDGGVATRLFGYFLTWIGAVMCDYDGLKAEDEAKKGFLDKESAQDNSQPQRSSSGESKGLAYAHKPDHYAQGHDAWKSVSGYFKGGSKIKSEPNPFTGEHAGKSASLFAEAFFGRCEELGSDHARHHASHGKARLCGTC